MPARVVGGRYRLDERLGEGSSGIVWKAQHLALGKSFALKLLHPEVAADDGFLAVRAAEKKYGKADRRPVAIHAHIAREDQVEAFKELGILPSFFPMHTFYWGDWHRDSVFGPERGANLAYVRELCAYWADGYDWRKWESALNAWPQFMTTIDGVDYDACRARAAEFDLDGLVVPVISLDDLKINKRAAGRHKDLADLDNLP